MIDTLIVKGQIAAGLSHALRDGGFGLREVPESVKRVIQEGAWKERKAERIPGNPIIRFNSFEEFITTAPLEGMGADMVTLRRLCRDDPEALDALDRVTQNPNGTNQHSEGLYNIQTLPPTGTTSSAALRRLRKDRVDLHARVLAKELSPHAAMVEAGFRERKISVSLDPKKLSDALKRHLEKEQINELVRLLGKTVTH